MKKKINKKNKIKIQFFESKLFLYLPPILPPTPYNLTDSISVVQTTPSHHLRKNDRIAPSSTTLSPIVVVDKDKCIHKLASIDNNDSAIINHHPINNNNSNNNNITTKKALTTIENNLLAIPVGANSCSTATSESGDNLSLCDGNSIDSLEVKMWHKSESESIAPSCSSLSMDSSTDEAIFEFMRRFVSILFTDSLAITLELKHQFGQYARVSRILSINYFYLIIVWRFF